MLVELNIRIFKEMNPNIPPLYVSTTIMDDDHPLQKDVLKVLSRTVDDIVFAATGVGKNDRPQVGFKVAAQPGEENDAVSVPLDPASGVMFFLCTV